MVIAPVRGLQSMPLYGQSSGSPRRFNALSCFHNGQVKPPFGLPLTLSDRFYNADAPPQVTLRRRVAFTTGLMHAAEAHGAVLRHGTVVDLVRSRRGAWSILAARWLPLPAVFGFKGHSLVFETGGTIPAEALFLEYREGERRNPDP
jgi:hypothetical protein